MTLPLRDCLKNGRDRLSERSGEWKEDAGDHENA